MNIFYLDQDPRLAAVAHCDKHVGKMVVETAQLLSTAHHVANTPFAPLVYKPTHINHPSAVWVRASQDHYSWTWELFRELANEFAHRRGKLHLSYRRLSNYLCHNPLALPLKGFTPPPQCMPEELRGPDTVEAYRRYYHTKTFAAWNWGRPAPSWWLGEFSTSDA